MDAGTVTSFRGSGDSSERFSISYITIQIVAHFFILITTPRVRRKIECESERAIYSDKCVDYWVGSRSLEVPEACILQYCVIGDSFVICNVELLLAG